MMRLTGLIATLFLMIGVAAQAAEPVKVGDAFPAFALKDSQAVLKTHADLTGDEGLVAIVTRSVEWCPYCQKQIMEFQTAQPAFAALGYHIAGISYDTPDVTAAFAEKRNVHFPLLTDQDSALIKALGILNEDHAPSTKFYGIPNPAVYIIGKDGAVSRIFAEEGYKSRPEIADILQFLSSPVARSGSGDAVGH